MNRSPAANTPPSTARRRSSELIRRLALLSGVAAGVALLASAVAHRVGGPGEALAALVGCGAAWLAAVAGSLPSAFAGARPAADRANALLAGMAVRFLLSLLLGTAALLLGGFSRGPLLLSLAAAYVLLLAAETWLDLAPGAGDDDPTEGRSCR